MNSKNILIILFLALAAIGIYLANSILHDGVSSRATPSKLESVLARGARHLAIPEEARSLKNPIASSPEALRDGLLHFADHCATCHANDGTGDTVFGRGLYPKPTDLRLPQTQNLSDGELFWTIENGVRFTGMPAFATPGAEDESWKLVLFIRHLPQLTPEERLEMDRNNPKSPDERAEEEEENNFLNGGQSPKTQEAPQHHH